jgi:hypothetical protein
MRRIYGWNKNNNVHILKLNDEKSNLTCCYITARFIKIGEKIIRLVLKNGVKIFFLNEGGVRKSFAFETFSLQPPPLT